MADTIIEAENIPDRAEYQNIKALALKGLSPPDTIGAVGPHQIVEMVNGVYTVYDKSAALVTLSALSTFWTDAGIGVAQEQPIVFDPVVQYDSGSGRWFALAEDNSFGNATSPDWILLAVSRGSDPTQGWRGYTLASNPPNTDPTELLWADQATLGFNQDGVFIAANMFPLGRNDFPPGLREYFRCA
ncbi:MAG TPA: hypothetical protein VK821_07635 [Dehalococcoidia bacterium]|nr:hypothetical protein [Dehalococcoidia bacterium]